MSSPEEIQEQIERTRAGLSADVDRLTEKVSPPRIVGRRVDSARSGISSLRERVMGSASTAKDSVGSATSSAA